MIPIVLEPDQAEVERQINVSWNAGNRNVLAVASTGWGKSVLIGEIAYKRYLIGSTQVKIAHRNELVGQLSMHIARRGIPHRIIAPAATVKRITRKHRDVFNGKSFVNPDANCSVAGIDTLIARQDELKAWAQQVEDWTIDEAHHVLRRNKWGKGVLMFPNAKGLGVTASPTRADGMGLGAHSDGVFEDMILAPPMRWLIDNGRLCDYEIAIPESDFHIDDSAIAAGGDYSPAAMRDASKRSHIVGDVVKEYLKRARGKRGICFATDVETANKIAEQFNEAGVRAASVSSYTDETLRDDYISKFRDGRLDMLVNVDLFGEGFDVPAVEVVIMARPTASLGVYLQQFGRVLRLLAGKLFGLVIDHVSNWKRHGFPDKAHYWTLDRREKRAKKEPDDEIEDLTACRGCSRPYKRVLPACPHCGWQPPVAVGGARTLEEVDGDLMLLDRDTLARMRAAMVLESPVSVMHRVSDAGLAPHIATAQLNHQMARHAAQQRLSAAIAQWAGIQRKLDRTDTESYRRFYLALGIDVLSILTLPRAEMEAASITVERWINEGVQRLSRGQAVV